MVKNGIVKSIVKGIETQRTEFLFVREHLLHDIFVHLRKPFGKGINQSGITQPIDHPWNTLAGYENEPARA